MNPWICPKCGRVWGPMVTGCGNCNNAPIATPWTAPTTPPPFDSPTNTPLPPLPRVTCESIVSGVTPEPLTEGPSISVEQGCAEATRRHLAEHPSFMTAAINDNTTNPWRT